MRAKMMLTVLILLLTGGNAAAQVHVEGNVFGGGNLADVGGNVTVNISAGTVDNDVYGGGAKANTNTGNWDFDGGTEYVQVNVTVDETVVTGMYTESGGTYTKITAEGTKAKGNTTYYKKVGVWKESSGTTGGYIAATSTTTSSTYYKTTVNLLGGTITGNAYGGGLGEGQGATGTPAYVYGDVKVNLNGLEAATDIDETTLTTLKTGNNARLNENNKVKTSVKGCAVTRVFGCNNLNGTPKGHVKVNVYATQNSSTTSTSILPKENSHTDKETGTTTTYDVTAVYGGGNLSPYDPVDAYSTNNDVKLAAKTEVLIDGCGLTSIKQVYGGGNAASAPATYVRVDGTFEIEELFGGGNGNDDYQFNGKWYKNPGANVGYTNYTHLDGNGDGSTASPYTCVDNDNAKTKAGRQTEANGYMYGSGIAQIEVFGGKIFASYGGSNKKGNVRVEARSKYEEAGDCALNVVETYGGGKDSEIDGVINLNVGCVKNMDQIFGGSKNAPVYSDIVLNIHNGHYHQVFGGNNTSGAIHGSITVNIEEKGCVPIDIDELYIGGYLAPYSIYGYKNDGTPLKEGDTGALETPYKQPRLNVISASHIGDIFGGGYQATVVGDPHVNVNMEAGKVEVKKTEITAADAATDEYSAYAFGESEKYYIYTYKYYTSATAYTEYKVKNDDDVISNISGKYYAPLTLGTIENVYGGGNEANIVGDTYVEIGTGKWLKDGTDDVWETKDDAGNTYTFEKKGSDTAPKWYKGDDAQESAPTPRRKAAKISGDVFGGGQGDATDVDIAKVEGNTNIQFDNGTIAKSVYGGGKLAQVSGTTTINITGGTATTVIGTTGEGGATYGNVYGGGFGHTADKLFGRIMGNTNVNISGGAILHNVYGGGAYGSVGDFTYDATSGMPTAATENTGACTVNITGGTIGTTGKNNGMVFGSSRGDVDEPGSIQDRLAWVYNTHVVIGKTGQGTDAPQPQIKGSVYGSGENGHTLQNTTVDVLSGTIGIISGEKVTDDAGIEYEGATYPYRGNVYGGGCGTDTYTAEGGAKKYNPLAGVVYGTTTVNIDGGLVVHNVYGAGAMGSVGKMTTTTSDNTSTTTFISGGTTTIEISGGTVGVSGTVGDGNVFGAARGDADTSQTDVALVKTTGVTISGTTTGTNIWGSVYGGGETGDVGTYTTDADGYNIYPDGTGVCTVSISGGTIHRNVFGAGKGIANTFECPKAMVNTASVTISNGVVNGNVYGGGEIGRVENNTAVTVGLEKVADGTSTYCTSNDGTDEGSVLAAGTPVVDKYLRSGDAEPYTYTLIEASAPEVKGSVFGAGAGKATHGYSALVRGNPSVTIQGNAKVRKNVYGGGEIATAGRYKVEDDLPTERLRGGDCTVIIQGKAEIGPESTSATDDEGNVFGACKGVVPQYSADFKKMNHNNGWDSFATVDKYLEFLGTLALATDTRVTIRDDVKIKGSVYGGGERGIVKQDVTVDILGGTISKDVYGGGSLADTQTNNWNTARNTWADDKRKADGSTLYKTTVNLTGGKLRNAYGGGLGQIERAAGQNVTALESIEARVYGDVLVELNNNNNGQADGDKTGCIVERVFGCNNQNGTPIGHVKVHVYATQNADTENYPKIKNKQALHTTTAGNLPETGSTSTYDVLAVYGGGNLSPYEPAGGKNTTENTEVIIDGCNLTSIRQVYGGGNAAPAPATYVRVNGTWEIEEVFGGGNGKDDYDLYGKTYLNPGANVGYYNYTHAVWNDTKNKYETIDYTADDGDGLDASTKPKRQANWGYGTGVAKTEIAGGKIHYVYGASNERGNIREVAISKYEELDDGCPMVLDQTYGGGKNSIIDGRIDMGLGCVHEMKETFGGSSAADVNSDIVLNITNGTYERVFGGNNTSGNVNGSITVNIYEDGCSPVRIGELYLGGYLAGYSIYGYKEVNGQQVPRTKEDWTALSAAQKEAEGLTVPRKDPRINVISATRIDNIYGGGYEAVVVGNPHVNVNMERGRIKGEYNTTDNPITTGLHEYEGNSNYNYTVEAIDGTTKDATLSIGTIGNIYGGGNRADIVGNTYVEMGTGMWLNADDVWETKNAAGVNYTYDATDKVWKYLVTTGEGDLQTTELTAATTAPTPARYTAKVTGNVFGGGDNAAVQGNTYVNVCAVNNDDPATTDVIELIGVTLPATVGSDVTIGGSVFGGGSKGAVGTYTTSTNASGGKEYNFSEDTGTCNVTIAGGTVGPETPTETSPGNVFGGGMGEALNSGTGAFMCEKAMVDHTNVVISNGTVNGTVYGGGEIGRVNHDTRVTIGLKRANTTDPAVSKPVVEGSVYGAGKGLSTHGYAALVRGNSYVTVQGDSKVKESVYGGGEIASVGKYTLDAAGMPQSLANQNSGYCNVIVQDNAEIGPDVAMKMITESGYPDDAGHVFGAGRGILPYEGYDLTDDKDIPWRVKGDDLQQWFGSGTVEINGAQVSVEYVPDDNQDPDYKKAYLRYIESQGLATQTYVTIAGNALVKGSVYGGSMNGHVQHNTQVTIAGGQIGCQKNTTGRLDPSVWGADYQVPDGTDLECASWDFTGDHLPYDIYDYQTGTTKPKPATDGHTFFGNVFGGGSGYYPYRQDPDYDTKDQVTDKSRKDLGYSDGLWHREAGSVGGSTVVNITGGHILTSVYGGNEQTDVGTYVKDSNYENTTTVVSGGKCTINMSGGTVGVPRTVAQMKAHPVTCYVFGAGKGDQRINFNKWTNVASTQVNISGEARIYGSTFGGGEDGHVVGNVETNIGGSFNMKINNVVTPVTYSNVRIGTTGTSGVDGNIFGGGRGFSETALTAGVVGGDVAVNIHNGTILGTVFGGGRLASVGTHFADAESADYGTMQNTITPATYYTAEEIAAAAEGDDAYGKSTSDIKTPESIHGKITVTIDGGTIGATDSNGKLATSEFSIGDVFGGCKGSTNDVRFGMSKNTIVNISGANTKVNGNVYGGGESGDVGTITRNPEYNYTWKNSDGGNNTAGNNITSDNKNSGICTVTITGGTIGDGKTSTKGNVFGAGKGVANTFWCEKAIAYATSVNISGATTVNGNVYGGGEVGRVEDDTKVIIGTAGESDEPDIKGSVFGAGAGLETHGYSALVRGNSIVTVQGKAKVGGSVFGGGETASLGRFILDENKMPKEPDGGGSSTVTITDNAKIGLSGTDHDVYGAGQGVTPDWKYDVSDSYDDRMNNSKRMVTYTPYNSETGKGHQSDDEMKKWDYYPYPENHPDYHKYVWEYYPDKVAYLEYLKTLAITSHPNVTIKKSATINGDVYGGGQRGVTLGDVEVNITGGTVAQDVYGGGALADTNKGNWDDSQYVAVTGLTSGKSSVKGLYTRTGSGTTEDPYKYAMTTDETAVENTQYYSKGTWAKYNQTDYTTTYKTTVTLTGGIIEGNVYGGGLGCKEDDIVKTPAQGTEGETGYVPAVIEHIDPVEAKVYGDVLVTLNGTGTEIPSTEEGGASTYDYCEVKHNIFGCNNENGSPKNAVTVHVYKTVHKENGTVVAKYLKEKNQYEVEAVYGGGNLAAYEPVNALLDYSVEGNKPLVDAARASVIIEGCDDTSIQTVYGGGNAASAPATNVTINSAYEIEEVFGGGNGFGFMADGSPNPGANVGYMAYPTSYDPPQSSVTERTQRFAYGSGEASVTIYGGRIHRVFGGSNTKGNVRKSAVTVLDDQDLCSLSIDEAYGGGKSAPMDAEAKLLMACIPGLKAAYGGAQDADIQDNVVLTITNGTFDRVFGGNNVSGNIHGTITVNVEETGCKPVIIGQLYGGGNLASYTAPWKDDNDHSKGRKDGPTINVKSFTSIGEIYGGGYGEAAVVTGDTYVNIDECVGKNASMETETRTIDGKSVTVSKNSGKTISFVVGKDEETGNNITETVSLPLHVAGKIGAVGTVYGGGNAAPVHGNTHVSIGTHETVTFETDYETEVVKENGAIVYETDGVTPKTQIVYESDGVTPKKKTVTVEGVDIRGNVYGAGYGSTAIVTGDTNVVIGKKAE